MTVKSTAICNHTIENPPQSFEVKKCPICKGELFYGGLSINSGGKIELISGEQAIKQKIRKLLLTPKRPLSQYGVNFNLLREKERAILELQRAITYLIKSQPLNLPLNEKIRRIRNINVKYTDDPRKVIVHLEIESESATIAEKMEIQI